MGDVVQLNAWKGSQRSSTHASAARVLEMQSPALYRACLYQVGFDDHAEWRTITPFKADYKIQGLISSPHLIATHRRGVIRVVRMLEGDRPPDLDPVDAMTVYLDAWVAFSYFERRSPGTYKSAQGWAVFDDGERFELPSVNNKKDSLGRRACAAVRATGLFEASTSEISSLMAPGAQSNA